MAQYEYIDPRTKQPFRVVAGDKVPEKVVRAWVGQNMPEPRSGPLEQTPVLSMPTPFEFTDNSVFSNPKGFLGPGVVANTISKLMADPIWRSETGGVTPDVVYKEGNKGLIRTGSVPAQIIAQRFVPGLNMNLLTRMATQGGFSGLEELLAGGDRDEVLKHGATGVGIQGGMEAVFRTLKLPFVSLMAKKILRKFDDQVEQATKQTAANAASMARNVEGKKLVQQMDERNIADLSEPITQAHQAKVAGVKAGNLAADRTHEEASHAAKVAHQQAERLWQAKTEQIKREYETQMAQQAERAATQSMEQVKQVMPEWREFTSDVKGLLGALRGDGKNLMGQAYNNAVQAAKGKAQETVPEMLIPLKDAQALRLQPKPIDPREVQGTSRDTAFVPGAARSETGMETVRVNTGKFIDAVTGMKGLKRDWDLYHRSMDMLDEAGVAIDEKARAAYRTGRGLIESTDKAGLIVQDEITKLPKIVPEKFTEWYMAKEANADALRNRGLGTHETPGGLYEAFSGAPAVPTLPPKPSAPPPLLRPQPTPEPPAPELPTVPERGPLNPSARAVPDVVNPPETPDFGEMRLPGTHYGRARAGAGLGGLLGLLIGGTHGLPGAGGGAVGGGTAGYGLGALLPDSVKTTLPIGGFDELLKALLTVGPAATRLGVQDPEGPQTELTQAEREASRAIQSAE